jgi:hypothetical protein
MYKIVAFVSDESMYSFIHNQLQQVTIDWEIVYRDDPRYSLWFSDLRTPKIVITKNNIRKTVLTAKVNDDIFMTWVNNNTR